VHLREDDVLFDAGDESDGLYLICRGVARVVNAAGVAVTLVGPGESFGEMGVLRADQEGRTAGVVAETFVYALHIRTETLFQLFRSHAQGQQMLDGLWAQTAEKFVLRILGSHHPYDQWPRKTLKLWVHHGRFLDSHHRQYLGDKNKKPRRNRVQSRRMSLLRHSNEGYDNVNKPRTSLLPRRVSIDWKHWLGGDDDDDVEMGPQLKMTVEPLGPQERANTSQTSLLKQASRRSIVRIDSIQSLESSDKRASLRLTTKGTRADHSSSWAGVDIEERKNIVAANNKLPVNRVATAIYAPPSKVGAPTPQNTMLFNAECQSERESLLDDSTDEESVKGEEAIVEGEEEIVDDNVEYDAARAALARQSTMIQNGHEDDDDDVMIVDVRFMAVVIEGSVEIHDVSTRGPNKKIVFDHTDERHWRDESNRRRVFYGPLMIRIRGSPKVQLFDNPPTEATTQAFSGAIGATLAPKQHHPAAFTARMAAGSVSQRGSTRSLSVDFSTPVSRASPHRRSISIIVPTRACLPNDANDGDDALADGALRGQLHAATLDSLHHHDPIVEESAESNKSRSSAQESPKSAAKSRPSSSPPSSSPSMSPTTTSSAALQHQFSWTDTNLDKLVDKRRRTQIGDDNGGDDKDRSASKKKASRGVRSRVSTKFHSTNNRASVGSSIRKFIHDHKPGHGDKAKQGSINVDTSHDREPERVLLQAATGDKNSWTPDAVADDAIAIEGIEIAVKK
jgi:hypothetical protein